MILHPTLPPQLKKSTLATMSPLGVLASEVRQRMMETVGEIDALLLTAVDEVQARYAASARLSACRLVSIARVLEIIERDRDRPAAVHEAVALREAVGLALSYAIDASSYGGVVEVVLDPACPEGVETDAESLTEIVTLLLLNLLLQAPESDVKVHVGSHSPSGDDRMFLMVRVVPDLMGFESPFAERRRIDPAGRDADASTHIWALAQLLSRRQGDLFELSVKGSSLHAYMAAIPARTCEAPDRKYPGLENGIDDDSVDSLRRVGHVLVADDNTIHLRGIARTLEQLSYQVTTATNGWEAFERFKERRFDFVLMDCSMPILDGCESARLIRAYEGSRRRTPILATTEAALETVQERAFAAGMDELVSKPLRKTDVARALMRLASSGNAVLGSEMSEPPPPALLSQTPRHFSI